MNYEMHGTPANGGKETRYKADRGVPGQTGELVAKYDGKHGWFWRKSNPQLCDNHSQVTVRSVNLKK